jgi:hypothetical protein
VAGSPYPITASGAVDADYAISYAAGSLTVTPAPLTITADDQTKVYGAALPTLTASYAWFVNGDSAASLTTPPTLSTSATAASHVAGSPYAITPSGASHPDYTISYAKGTLTITPAALTISADDESMAYGGPMPTLKATYAGFVNGDTPASLSTPAFLTTSATAISPMGLYPILVSGAISPDYTITLRSGTLRVTPPQVVYPLSSRHPAGPHGRFRTAFVTTLYHDILGRDPEAAGLCFWVKALARGETPMSVAFRFWRSKERQTLLKLHRAPHIGLRAALNDALRSARGAHRTKRICASRFRGHHTQLSQAQDNRMVGGPASGCIQSDNQRSTEGGTEIGRCQWPRPYCRQEE